MTCPFPGLRRFDESNAHLFFGRERETRSVVERLAASRFLAITGESGCGKSSLIRAGVVPALHASGVPWRVAILQPGNDPFGRLARALAEAGHPGASELDVEIAEDALRSSSQGIGEALRQAKRPAGERVLIVVDQFEELFRFKRSGDSAGEDARAFVRLLLTAASHDVDIVITMRSDYLGDCAQFTGLPEAINGGEYLVPRMTRDQLRAAIEGPASVAGTPVAPRLVARILNETGDDPGELPAVQHALMRTWRAWQAGRTPDQPVDIEHYEAIGTLSFALSKHAGEALESLGSPELRSLAERFFRALTEVRPGGRPIRRPSVLERLAQIAGADVDDVRAVAMHFAAPGRSFVCYPGDPGPPAPRATIDITHESLIARWARLREWVQAEAADAELYRSLARDAQLHASGERSLWREPELSRATRWFEQRRPSADWAGQYAPGFEQAVRFLEASKRASVREKRIRQGAIWGLAALVLIAVSAFAWAKRQQAETERVRAEAAVAERDYLQRRVAELTAENPQLSEAAVALRKENREVQWTILQLQTESSTFEKEAVDYRSQNQSIDAQIQRTEAERASLSKRAADEEQKAAALKEKVQALEAEERKVNEEWDAAWEANRKLREKALEAGIMVEASMSAAGIRPPEPIRPLTEQQVASVVDQRVDRPKSDAEAKLRFQLQELERENLRLKQSVEGLREENQRLRTQESSERERNAGLRAERDRLQKRHDELNAKLRGSEQAAAVALSRLRERESDTRAAALQVEALQFRINSKRRAISMLLGENQLIERALRVRR